MFEFIEGLLKERNPAYCVIETGGIGYYIQISLPTFSQLEGKTQARLFLHQVIREDAHLLFGFYAKQEREMFRLLLTVSGIGANTARMMLSSLSSEDLRNTILSGNISVLQGIKGIGAKTAQRIVIELQDKIGKGGTADLFPMPDNRLKEEALSALIILGFNKGESDKVISKILQAEQHLSLEELIKKALKQL
jgi:Holliday junction DNA helicase RuvA